MPRIFLQKQFPTIREGMALVEKLSDFKSNEFAEPDIDLLRVVDHQHIIDALAAPSHSDERIAVLNPATEEQLGTIPHGCAADVDDAVQAARLTHDRGSWRTMGFRERSRILHRVADLLRNQAEKLAWIETLDQGRPLRQSLDMMVPLAADAWDFFASALVGYYGDAYRSEPWAFGYTLKHPLGVVGCIVPSNVPLVLSSEQLAPALAAGNSVVLKSPPDCPLSSIKLVECIHEAGVPKGVVNLVHGGRAVGQALVEHPGIDMIAFTGSTATGKSIMGAAASTLKRLLLELGGKAPFIVFSDADLDAAIDGAILGAYLNGGQICMSATRLLLHESIYDEFVARFAAATRQLKVGPGADPATRIGPMVSAALRDRIERHIAAAIEAGADALSGGSPLRDGAWQRGFWVNPTVLANVPDTASVWRDEVFGPVPVVRKFHTPEDAIRLANDTPYGLAGSVWTTDLRTAHTMAEAICAGYLWINEHLIRAPGLPFGGLRQSGLGSQASLRTLDSYSQLKSVFVDRSPQGPKPRHRMV